MISFTILFATRWRVCLILLSGTLVQIASAQSILNGNFSSNSTDWTMCNTDVAATLLFGGPLSTNKVAGVNGGLLPGITSDDNRLCQSISGFTVGSIYALSFDATRCQLLGTPGTVTSFINIDGGALDGLVSRSGGWNLSSSSYNFTATQTTHTLTISPGQTAAFGVVFDNLEITLVSPLPIELLFFTAAQHDEHVELSWATATEYNNDLFAVERSADSEAWTAIAMVDGAGQSLSELHYAITDQEPLDHLSYYRLRQFDVDGASTVSDMVPVILVNDEEIEPWPDPASDLLNLALPDMDAPDIQVFDTGGRSMHVLWWQNGHLVTLRVTDLVPGLYYVRTEQNGIPRTAPFLVH